MSEDWRPTASLASLRLRGELLGRLREFFRQRGVLEVDTPLMSRAAATDPHLHSFVVESSGEPYYLQTSPEFAMKRLLAAGSGPIYQLCKAFRQDEAGRNHNPEFSMLEWYRPGFDEAALMEEVEALVRCCQLSGRTPLAPFARRSYRSLFRERLQLDPFSCELAQLRARAVELLEVSDLGEHRDDWLQLLFTHCIEPHLSGGVFVTEFPASQAALARIDTDAEGVPVARRFELYIDGVELANGYRELTDAREQARRFREDNARRRAAGLPLMPEDQNLLRALESGLPDCSGVALGFDRLLMLASGAGRLSEVLGFTAHNA